MTPDQLRKLGYTEAADALEESNAEVDKARVYYEHQFKSPTDAPLYDRARHERVIAARNANIAYCNTDAMRDEMIKGEVDARRILDLQQSIDEEAYQRDQYLQGIADQHDDMLDYRATVGID